MNYSNNPNDSRTLQFELWQECNNKCDFCYLGISNRYTSDNVKIESLKKTYTTICDETNYPKYNCIGYIGGEFFQGQLKNPEVKLWFYKLMTKTAELYNNGTIRQVWISATLTIGNQSDLYEILKLFNNWDGIWITTSWDTKGRFKSEKMLSTWEYHVKNLTALYPGLKINITTILTGDLIDKYLNGEISFNKMMIDYNASFFFKQCGSLIDLKRGDMEEIIEAKNKSNNIIPNFFPTRSKFIKFLIKFKQQETIDTWSRLFNIEYRADNLIRNYNDGHSDVNQRYKHTKAEDLNFKQMECGHPTAYAAYIDSNKCCLCDKIKISQFN